MAKPIFVATHPRACSTAFERVFMTQRDTLTCFHEPFGDAFYYGPERISERYEGNEKARVDSGFSASTFDTVVQRLQKADAEMARGGPMKQGLPLNFPTVALLPLRNLCRQETLLLRNALIRLTGRRGFIKDMAYFFVPPEGKPASIAPSLAHKRKGVGTSLLSHGSADKEAAKETHSEPPYPYNTEAEPENPTVVPQDVWKKFHFAFLIRHPSKSIPSFWRCCVPPQNEVTGFEAFMANEAGYAELRAFFDYLKASGQVGPAVAFKDDTQANGAAAKDRVEITVVDADDLLDYPAEMVEKFCKSVGLPYQPDMLKWGDEISQTQAIEAFEKWRGWHDDAINSKELRPRQHKHVIKSIDEEHAAWVTKFGADAASHIKKAVEANLDDYNYMKQYAIRVGA